MTHEEIWQHLNIDESFRYRHEDTIRKRLLSAGKAIEKGKRRGQHIEKGARFFLDPIDVSAINQCLHLASTVLLLGANSNRLRNVVNRIQAETDFRDLDPTTVVTSVVLYKLLLGNIDKQKSKIEMLNKSAEEKQELIKEKTDEVEKLEQIQELTDIQRYDLQELKDDLEMLKKGPEQKQRLIKEKTDEIKRLEQIQQRFSDLNWMINNNAVSKLNLKLS
jgi:hypothetical protein